MIGKPWLKNPKCLQCGGGHSTLDYGRCPVLRAEVKRKSDEFAKGLEIEQEHVQKKGSKARAG
jgi:hypothetical protein